MFSFSKLHSHRIPCNRFWELAKWLTQLSSISPNIRKSSGHRFLINLSKTKFSDTADRPSCCEYIQYKADEFRLWLATRCCTCLSSVPSFALVIIAAVLIMLLIATIPLAFAMTYSRSQAITAEETLEESENINVSILYFYTNWRKELFGRFHHLCIENTQHGLMKASWFNIGIGMNLLSWKQLLYFPKILLLVTFMVLHARESRLFFVNYNCILYFHFTRL